MCVVRKRSVSMKKGDEIRRASSRKSRRADISTLFFAHYTLKLFEICSRCHLPNAECAGKDKKGLSQNICASYVNLSNFVNILFEYSVRRFSAFS